MGSLLFIIVFYFFLLWICYALRPYKMVLTPQFIYIASYLPGLIIALFYVSKWELSFSRQTIATLILGPSSFVIASLITQYLCIHDKKKRANKPLVDIRSQFSVIHANIVWAFAFVNVFTILWTSWILISRFGTNLSSAIFYYRLAYNNGTEDSDFGVILRNLRYIVSNSCYVWVFLLAQNAVYKQKKYLKPLLVVFITGSISELLSGARGNFIFFIVAFALDYYMIFEYKNNWGKHLPSKTVARIILIAVVIILSYQSLGNFLGRRGTITGFDAVALYMSAEYKNLDSFIRYGSTADSFLDTIILRKPLSQLTGLFGYNPFPKETYTFGSGLGFQNINGYKLGNVYTIYYDLYYDGGIAGVIIYSVVMAVILQLMFSRAMIRMKSNKNHSINLSLIIYSIACTSAAFSFFADRFFDYIFDFSFIKRIIIIWIVIKVITKIKISNSSFAYTNTKNI